MRLDEFLRLDALLRPDAPWCTECCAVSRIVPADGDSCRMPASSAGRLSLELSYDESETRILGGSTMTSPVADGDTRHTRAELSPTRSARLCAAAERAPRRSSAAGR